MGECKMFVKIFGGSSFSEKTSHPCKWKIRWISLQSACVPVAPERERGIRWTRVKANQSKKVRWICGQLESHMSANIVQTDKGQGSSSPYPVYDYCMSL